LSQSPNFIITLPPALVIVTFPEVVFTVGMLPSTSKTKPPAVPLTSKQSNLK